MLATLLLALPAAPALSVDAADDQYHFIVGLASPATATEPSASVTSTFWPSR